VTVPASPRPAFASDAALRRGLVLLTLVNLLNYLDRFVVSALVESLKRSALALTDAELGSLMTGFVVVYTLASPIFGTLGDRARRPRLVALGVAFWSAATALSALARSFHGLFVARAAVGVGEAAYGTIAPSLLADYFPRAQRGRAFAVFFAAIPVGSALGYVVGGLVDRAFGWNAAFLVAGLPGLLLAGLILRLPDPPRGASDAAGTEVPVRPASRAVFASVRDGLGAYPGLLRNRPYRLTVLGYAAYTFALGGMAFWMPAFLERVRGVPRAEATVVFGAIVVATGFVGTFAGGWIGDRLLRRTDQAYLWVSGVATLLAVPCAIVVFASASRSVYVPALVAAQLLLFASTGPVNSAIVNVVAPTERATAVALSILAIHLLGDVPSPVLIGLLSDAASLGRAVLIVPVAVFLSGAIWTYAAWRGERS